MKKCSRFLKESFTRELQMVSSLRNRIVPLFSILSLALFSLATHAKDFQENPLTKINGTRPPGKLMRLQNVSVMLDTINSEGKQLIITKGTRKAGTRVGIHIHKFGGHTCVLSGTITDFIQGTKPKQYPAGTCYYMPPNIPMSAANLGTKDAILIDTFIVPKGQPTITILEPGY
jgi:quercetin dioxygenase-like cupin family protein